ncbi:hypothetical protein JCM31598_17020 [Desulfonatronum parangueonense]
MKCRAENQSNASIRNAMGLQIGEHSLMMGACPVNAPTGRAFVELFVIAPGQRFKAVRYVGFGSWLKPDVAVDAPRKGLYARGKTKQVNNFLELLPGAMRTNQPPENNAASPEQTMIPAQQNASTARGFSGYRRIRHPAAIRGIQPDHAQQFSKAVHVFIDQKGKLGQRNRA